MSALRISTASFLVDLRVLATCSVRGRRLDLLSRYRHDKSRQGGLRATTECRHQYCTRRRSLAPDRDSARIDYDWSSVLPMIHAAQDTGVQIIWDICHYGWPDDIDVFRPEFVRRFRAFARAFASLFAKKPMRRHISPR